MSKYMISVVDAHVAGEPLRLITGCPKLKGNTMVEKTEYMKEHYDFIRTAAMLEPRGHGDMYGAVLTEPTDPRADLGIIFIDGGLYNAMCGHGSIAIGTIAVELGYVIPKEPVTEVILETRAGLVTVQVQVKDGKASGATLRGVPSFLYKQDIELEVLGQKILVDIVYGGNFFAMVNIDQLGLKHAKDYLPDFTKLGLEIRRLANQLEIRHPEKADITTIDDILFVGDPAFSGDTHKSLCFLGQSQIDRSPCGTGTSARMAAMYTKGLLASHDTFYHESIIGTVFEGRIESVTKVGDFTAIIPLISSRAYIMGFGNLILDTDDPLSGGFLLR